MGLHDKLWKQKNSSEDEKKSFVHFIKHLDLFMNCNIFYLIFRSFLSLQNK